MKGATKFIAIGYRNGQKIKIKYDKNNPDILTKSLLNLDKRNYKDFIQLETGLLTEVAPPGFKANTTSLSGLYFFLLIFFDKTPEPIFKWNGKSIPEMYNAEYIEGNIY